MKKLFKIFLVLSSLFTIHYSLFPAPTGAVCPVCTIAVAGGLGLSRWLGIDDTVSGIWIGGLILSSSFWLSEWLEKKSKSKFKYLDLAIIALMFLFVLLPLAWTGIIGHPFNKLWGIDKLVLGTAVGSLAFSLGVLADKKTREIKGERLFNFQRVIFPISFLFAASIVFYFVTR